MNFDYLKVFHLVATKKNFSETAKALHLSQPTVSMQIRHLEEALGTKLFERTTKRMSLTREGELLYHYAGKILGLVRETERELALLSSSIKGSLTIGASLTIGEHHLPYVLGKFKQEFPQVTLNMQVFNSTQIIEKLRSGDIDLGFIESGRHYPGFEQQPFFEDELVVIASPNASYIPETSDGRISVNSLFTLPIILREKGSGTRQVLEEYMHKQQFDPRELNILIELEHTESIKSAVESGMGISILSKSAVKKELDLGTLRAYSLHGMKLYRYFDSVYNPSTVDLPAETFLTFIEKHYNKKREEESADE